MKKNYFLAVLLCMLGINNLSSAQCGINFQYFYAVGPCDTQGHSVQLSLSGSVAPYTILWENSVTAPANSLDSGYHYVCVWDANGCQQCDTLEMVCIDFNGTTTGITTQTIDDQFAVSQNGNVLLINSKDLTRKYSFDLTDLNGKQCVQRRTDQLGSVEMDISMLRAGYYIFGFYSEGRIYRKPVVLVR